MVVQGLQRKLAFNSYHNILERLSGVIHLCEHFKIKWNTYRLSHWSARHFRTCIIVWIYVKHIVSTVQGWRPLPFPSLNVKVAEDAITTVALGSLEAFFRLLVLARAHRRKPLGPILANGVFV